MLTLDKSLQAIEVTEDEVLEVHRSTAAIAAPVEGLSKQPCTAFLCGIKKNETPRIYVGLVSKDNRIFIYIPAKQPESMTAYAKTLKEVIVDV